MTHKEESMVEFQVAEQLRLLQEMGKLVSYQHEGIVFALETGERFTPDYLALAADRCKPIVLTLAKSCTRVYECLRAARAYHQYFYWVLIHQCDTQLVWAEITDPETYLSPFGDDQDTEDEA